MPGAPVTRDFAAEQAASLLTSLLQQMKRLGRSAGPEPVHDLRVAIRRFTQALVAFEPCFESTQKSRRKLKRMLSLAGEVRNLDIAVELVQESAPDNAGTLVGDLKKVRAVNVLALREYLKSRTVVEWKEKLMPMTRRRAGEFGSSPVEKNAGPVLADFTEAFARKGNVAAGKKASAHDLHQFRIAAKKLRYALDLFTPLYGDALTPSLRQLAGVQKILGQINDYATVREILAEVEGAGEVVKALKTRQREKTGKFLELWKVEFEPVKTLEARLVGALLHAAGNTGG